MKNRKRNRKNKKTLQIIYHEIIIKKIKQKKSSRDYPENRTIFLPGNAGSIDPGSKSYDAGPSNRVTQEVLRRELTAPEIAGKYQIHPGKTETPRLQQESGTEELSALQISKLAVGRLRNMVAQRLSPGLFIQNSPAGGEAQQHQSTKSSRKTATDYVTRRRFSSSRSTAARSSSETAGDNHRPENNFFQEHHFFVLDGSELQPSPSQAE